MRSVRGLSAGDNGQMSPPRLRQRDGVSCGPAVAIVAAARLDPGYAAVLDTPEQFAAEQARWHRRLNRVWPRALGTTPMAVARALSAHCAVGYRWRLARRRHDRLLDVREAVLLGWPVALLVGRFIPRHWVLLESWEGGEFSCYEPSSGSSTGLTVAAVRSATMTGVGYPRAFAFVLPTRLVGQEKAAAIASNAATVHSSLAASWGSGQLDSLAATTPAERLT